VRIYSVNGFRTASWLFSADARIRMNLRKIVQMMTSGGLSADWKALVRAHTFTSHTLELPASMCIGLYPKPYGAYVRTFQNLIDSVGPYRPMGLYLFHNFHKNPPAGTASCGSCYRCLDVAWSSVSLQRRLNRSRYRLRRLGCIPAPHG